MPRFIVFQKSTQTRSANFKSNYAIITQIKPTPHTVSILNFVLASTGDNICTNHVSFQKHHFSDKNLLKLNTRSTDTFFIWDKWRRHSETNYSVLEFGKKAPLSSFALNDEHSSTKSARNQLDLEQSFTLHA